MADATELATAHGEPAVAAAIVTGPLGVLVGRRRDGEPLWTFPGGKIEPGESPTASAVRETLEETGIVIRATGVIGSRVHPVTGVLIVYVAAVPVNGARALAGPYGELAEVRWVGAAEATELMSGMFGLVREHVRSKLRG